jgi:ABC-type glycerol-3-phosphate transport system substrate-binding protein
MSSALDRDIITGNTPDILFAMGNQDMDGYISKGVFADLLLLDEADETFTFDDYLQNIVEAYKVGDSLYTLPTSFAVNSYVGKKEKFERFIDGGVSLDEMKQVMSEKSAEAFVSMTANQFITTSVLMNMAKYINPETGKCSFDSPEFIALMEFAKTLPEKDRYTIANEAAQKDQDNAMQYYNEADQWMMNAYNDDKALLQDAYLYNLYSYGSQKEQFGDGNVFVGMPGVGSYIMSNDSFYISATCTATSGAWDFIKRFLSDEYQTSDTIYNFPVKISAFDALKEKLFEQYKEEDERSKDNGATYRDDIMIYSSSATPVMPDMVSVQPRLTEDEADEILEFIKSVDKITKNNPDITDIITEEFSTFYAGAKSAAETAKIIQNRAQVVIGENW